MEDTFGRYLTYLKRRKKRTKKQGDSEAYEQVKAALRIAKAWRVMDVYWTAKN